MLFAPKDFRIGDPTIVRVGDEYHYFTEGYPLQPPPGQEIRGPIFIMHFKSKNGLDWDQLPNCIDCGPEGSWDAYNLYHFDVFIHGGTWHLFYTGLDKRGPGQQQATGLATSKDGITWTKHPNNPVTRADPRFYEQAIPPEATYQKKDGGRLWFRDPYIIHDRENNQFCQYVMGRDLSKHPDVRACITYSTSKDLVHWETHGPVYSPGRFHTLEVPVVFEHNGRHYLIVLSHHGWGAPYLTTDPYQNAGAFYSISDTGPAGPFIEPKDEILIAAMDQIRTFSCRIVDNLDGRRFLWANLAVRPGPDDAENRHGDRNGVLSTPKPIRITEDGSLHVMYPKQLEVYTKPVEIPSRPQKLAEGWRASDSGGVIGKNFKARSVCTFDTEATDFIFSAKVRFIVGERAGIVARADERGASGWQIIADRRKRRIEFGILGTRKAGPGGTAESDTDFAAGTGAETRTESFIDARAWEPKDEIELKIFVDDVSVEIYADDRLMIHQVRHREVSGRIGYVVERAEAEFTQPKLLTLTR